MGVATGPGWMTETAMPEDASSMRQESAIASSANLDALYGAVIGNATRPLSELMNTMRPRFARIWGRNACVTATWPMTFTSSTLRTLEIGRYSSGPGVAMPALLTRPATPAEPTAAATVDAAAAMLSGS